MNNDNSYEETVRVASTLYEKSGRVEGRDFDNWIEAERIVRAGEQFGIMFMQMLMHNPSSASKLMDAIKPCVDLGQTEENTFI